MARWLHRRTNLGVKLFVPLVLYAIPVIAVFAMLNAQALHREITRQYEQRARGAAVLLDHEITEAGLLEHPAEIAPHIYDLMVFYPDLDRVSVYAAVGERYQVIASSDPARVGKPADPEDVEPVRTGAVRLQERVESGRRILEVNYPLRRGSGIPAVLGVYASLEERDRKVAELVGWIAALAAVTLLGTLGLLYWVVKPAVLTPLRGVLESVERVAAGRARVEDLDRWDSATPEESQDEVVRFARVFGALIHQIHGDREQLREMAITDPLTGLHNRHFFKEIIQREMAQAERNHEPFTVAVVDVNGLREINNRFGHPAGDEILRRTADFLRRHVRASDEVIRWGGDEFLILMSRADAAQARAATTRLKTGLAAENATRNAQVPLRFAIGVATWVRGQDLEAVLREADARMYQDKQLTS